MSKIKSIQEAVQNGAFYFAEGEGAGKFHIVVAGDENLHITSERTVPSQPNLKLTEFEMSGEVVIDHPEHGLIDIGELTKQHDKVYASQSIQQTYDAFEGVSKLVID